MENIILTTPILIILYGIELFLGIISLNRPTGMILSSISIVLCILTSGYAFLKGASIYEVCIVLLIFLIVNLTIFTKGGGVINEF